MKLLLNADCGEWESPQLTAQILPLLDLANVACGGHAGTPESLVRIAELAANLALKLGAHPGHPGDGRSPIDSLHPDQFCELVERQLATFCAHAGEPHHLKLHGTLYHLSERDPAIRSILLRLAAEHRLPLICLASGSVAAEAHKQGIPVLEEAFLDRGYLANGSLVPRGQSGDLLAPGPELETRLAALVAGHPLESIEGKPLPLCPATLCVHADSPASLEFIRRAHACLSTEH